MTNEIKNQLVKTNKLNIPRYDLLKQPIDAIMGRPINKPAISFCKTCKSIINTTMLDKVHPNDDEYECPVCDSDNLYLI